ncbi:hypothetical protein K525DRAFT_270799 [Schizophyllum commune Loenen D]|nr:hypothetical protein K525DRAFT_270799 [Schizophyllum commune Loenen D]
MPSRAIALAFLAACAHARPRNITLDDDSPGNSVASISYDPAGAWFEGQLCESCRAMPDRNTVYNGTWHHTTDDNTIDTQDTTMTIQFTGTALYVYCVIANNVSEGTGTMANYDFTLDGQDAGNYHHDPENVTDYFYNVPVYTVSGLENDSHELIVNIAGGSGVSGSSLMLFDYFTYTYDDDPSETISSSTTPTASASATSSATPKSKTNVVAVSPIATGEVAATSPTKSLSPIGASHRAPSDAGSLSVSSPTVSAPSTSKTQMALDTRVRDMEARIAVLQDQHGLAPASNSGEEALRRQIDSLQAEIALLHDQQREMMNNMSAPPPGYSDV